jgi:sugar phosphate isomerase/epimerase
MRLSIAVAQADALPGTYAVLRGLESSIGTAAALGYAGIELAVKTADEIDRHRLAAWLDTAGLEVSGISTGQVFTGLGLSMTEPDPAKRRQVREVLAGIIDLAAEFGRLVIVGRIRGQIGSAPREEAEGRFVQLARELCDYAAQKDVTLVLEPINRYEIDFVHSVPEGFDLVRKVDRPNMKLMADLFHMNIEDVDIAGELARHRGALAYLHLADSNRLAPGQGHLNFSEVFAELRQADYRGWLAVEILPEPDPDTAARQAADFLRPLLPRYGSG